MAWPSGNEWDVPDLLPELQGDGVDLPVGAWGAGPRRVRTWRGTWLFYVDDYRFNGLWSEPMAPVNTGCVAAAEPNYSVFEQTPFPVALWATYRKRWLARFWQSRGIRIWVDLNVAAPWSALNLVGVPEGWKAYATRGYANRPDDLYREHSLACEQGGGSCQLLVWSGGESIRRICEQLPGAIYFDSDTEPRKRGRSDG